MIQIGDIIIVKSNSFIGRSIRFITKSWASHAAVYVGNSKVFEARPSGAGWTDLHTYFQKGYDVHVFRLKVSPEELKRFIAILVTKVGRGYDFLQIGYLFVVSVLGLRNKVSIKTAHSKSICSEIIFEALSEAGIKWNGKKQSNTTPGDFENCPLFERII